MILFHNTFLALKAQDEHDPVRNLEDHILVGEVTRFSGLVSFRTPHVLSEALTISSLIQDDGYKHVLQVFTDEDSGGVRLQASIFGGQMKKYVTSLTKLLP